MVAKARVYTYATGAFTYCKIARCLNKDVVFRVLAAANLPPHRRQREARQLHLAETWAPVVRLAPEAGLV